MLWSAWVALGIVVAGAAVSQPDAGAPIFAYDFEAGANLADYEGLSATEVDARVVEPGADGTGHCLQLRNKAPSRYCTLTVTHPFTVVRNIVLSFDYRAEIEAGKPSAYVACLFFGPEDKQFFGSDKFTSDWRHAEFSLGELNPSNQGRIALGGTLERVNLYARAQGETQAIMTLWLDNIRLVVRGREGRVSDKVRVSYSNPPLFDWTPAEEGGSVLEYSLDPHFPAGATTRVELSRSFYMPPEALAPGKWYWRVWGTNELSEGWSDAEAIDIVPEAHRFTTPPVDEAALAAAPHPRVIVTSGQREGLTDERRAQLVAEAQKLHDAGVPDDPPPYQEGNLEWPTWIDWYGKVHGGITSRTGGRLQRMGEILAITGDAQVRDWTREMALAAARWDPGGGSAIGRGDIGAQHLLRGLCWCYDALHDGLNAEDAATLRSIIITRAEQFERSLLPFRGGEANNHAWLKALALGEAGLVLLGEHPAAGAWAECSRELYIGRFLCIMGYQGENNEGLSYWNYGLGFIIRYADMMKHTCGIDLYQHPWLNQTDRFPMYCAPRGAWAISFADTGMPNHGMKGPACQSYVRDLALRTRDPYALWYSGATEPVDGLEPKAPTDLPPSICYPHIGWALFHTNLVDGTQSVEFGMRSGPFWAGHQHDDQNGFVIHAYGEKLAIDSGYYDWYGSPHFTQYSTLTKAHNSILVNGEGQAHMQPGADGRIAAFFDSPQFGYVVGDASDLEVYQGKLKRFDRTVVFVKPGLFVIHDSLESAIAPARYDWLLHTVAPIEPGPAPQSFRLTSGAASLHGWFLLPADVETQVTKGFPVEPVDGYSTRPVPPEKYVDEWTLTATPQTPRESESFLTVLVVRREGDQHAGAQPVPWVIVETGTASVATDGVPEIPSLVAFRKVGATRMAYSVGGVDVDTDASVFANGLGLFVVGATDLTVGGVVWLRSTAPVTASLAETPGSWSAHLQTAEPARVSLRVKEVPKSVTVDGQPAALDFDANTSLATVRLEAGDHVIGAVRD